MIARTGIVSLALMIGLALPMGGAAAAAGERSDVEAAVFKREDGAVVAVADDEDDDARDGANSASNSGAWSTNSRKTPVTRDRDLSRGGLTRDRTDDGKGKPKRDWSKNKTNDRSRNDSR